MAVDKKRIEGLAEFRYALRRFLVVSEEISRAGGITPQQYQALLAIRACEGMAIKDLSAHLLLKHHAAVQLVDRLAESGLAVRRQSAEDRRRVRLALTRRGAWLIDRLAEQHFEAWARAEPALARALRRLRQLAG